MSEPELPPSLARRPYDRGLGVPVPFVHEYDDGRCDLTAVNRARAVQCALSRVCAMCAQSLSYPLAFLGDRESAEARTFAYPPMHVACAEAALRLIPGVAGTTDEPTMLTTTSFEVERPMRRGEPILFRPAAGEVRSYGPTAGSGGGPP